MKNNRLEHRVSLSNLPAEEDRLHIFISSCKDYALLMLDPEGHIISWNLGAENIKGYKSHEIIGKHFSVLYPEEARLRNFPEHELEMAVANGRFEDEGWRRRKDGSLFWANVIITPLYDNDKKLLGFGKITRDLSERRNMEEKIVYLSRHDSLTNLFNRVGFTETLETEIENSFRTNKKFAILLLDLDNFKKMNDSFGHHVGDQLLIHIARYLQENAAPSDIVARIGGDEFAIIFNDIDNFVDLSAFAHNLVQHFNKPFKFDERYFHLTISIGMVLYGEQKYDTITLLKNAEIAMYTAKKLGGNSYQLFSEELNSEVRRLFKLENELSGALANDQLFLVYQPQYSLPEKTITGIEVLLRWKDPNLGVISPSEFIPIAEKNGLIVMLGEWVLRKACSQIADWMRQFHIPKELKIAVNVSPLQLVDSHFLNSFLTILEETQIPAHNLVLEITETAVMTNILNLDPIFDKLKEIGVSVSIDDFGVGYSSLSRLKDLPVNSLKIDKSLISHLENKNNAKIVESIIGLGNSLGISVIPEGVETEEQIQLLMKYHCKMVQGYYFGIEPFSADEMTTLLKTSLLPKL